MNIFLGAIFLISIIADQLVKFWADAVLKDGTIIVLIDNFLRFCYVENRGAAFGMLQDQRLFFIVITVLMMVVLSYIYFKNKDLTWMSRLSIVLIAGGAMGNFIDRVRLGYVIDFIDVTFGKVYDFPVFNIADSCVVCGTILLLILVLLDKFEMRVKDE